MSMLILLVLLVVLGVYAVGVFNGLVGARNSYKNAFAQIDVQLKRRYDLIPNLVETAKGYMKHERETLEAVIQARNSAVSGLAAAKANPGDPSRDAAARRRRERADADARPAVRAVRGVSGSEGEPEHDAAHRGADLDREQGRVRAPGLQRRRHGLQQPARDVSRARSSPNMFQFQPAELLKIESETKREAPKVSVHLIAFAMHATFPSPAVRERVG